MKNSPTEVKKERNGRAQTSGRAGKNKSVTKRTSFLAVPRMTVTQTTIPH